MAVGLAVTQAKMFNKNKMCVISDSKLAITYISKLEEYSRTNFEGVNEDIADALKELLECKKDMELEICHIKSHRIESMKCRVGMSPR